LAHILGFGGYYIIKSVTYKLGQTEDNFEISVNGTFMGTDAIKKGTRKVEETTKLEDNAKCVEAFKKFQTRVHEVGGDIPESMLSVSVATVPDVSYTQERASELPPSDSEEIDITAASNAEFETSDSTETPAQLFFRLVRDVDDSDLLEVVTDSGLLDEGPLTHGVYSITEGSLYKGDTQL
jgi:hypothetical protein